MPATLAVAHAPPHAAAAPSPLVVPDEFRRRLDRARSEGVDDARQFAEDHGAADRWLVPAWALHRLPFPPGSDAADLAYLRRVAKRRSTAGVVAARAWAERGLDREWDGLLAQYTARASPEQARLARRLLHDALAMTNSVTQTAKAAAARKRPFVVDPTLPVAVRKPGNNPSYPSGHTSAAFAACLVLAHLMPDRAAEFLDLASEASWSRVYAGVHFPSDVVAGVRLATAVTTYLNQVSGTQAILGTRLPAATG